MPQFALTCPLDCPDACGVLVEADAAGRFQSLRGNPAHSWSRGSLCGKTAIYGDLIHSPERLRRPLLREAGGSFREVSWERALAEIASRLAPLRSGEILALCYAGNMGQVARRYPLRVLHCLGASETDGGICDNTATQAWHTVLGHVVGADLELMQEADLLVLWGIDVRRTHQHALARIHDLLARGVGVWIIDIYRTDTITSLEKLGARSLVLHPGTDAMLALALARLAYESGSAQREYLARECFGSEEFEAHVRSGHELEHACAVTGLAPAAVLEFANALARSRRSFWKTGVGFTRRRNGGMNLRAVASLAAVHARADALHFQSAEHFGLTTDVVERPDLRPADAPRQSIRHVELGRELLSGRFRAAVVWGHNPAVTVPDSRRVRAGLAQPDLFLVVHELFMTETAALADVVLPAAAFVEQSDVFRSYGHRIVQYARKACVVPAEQRSNVDTFRALARELGLPPEVYEVSEDSLCHELLQASRERFSAEEFSRVLAGEPVKLERPRFQSRGTPSGRIELKSQLAAQLGQPALASFVPDDGAGGHGAWQLVLAPSIATHNSTYSHSPRHLRRAGAPLCWMHPLDAQEHGVGAGDRVRLFNEQGSITLRLGIAAELTRGMLRIDGLPRAVDIEEGIGVNCLVSSAISDLGQGNVLYSTRVDLECLRPCGVESKSLDHRGFSAL